MTAPLFLKEETNNRVYNAVVRFLSKKNFQDPELVTIQELRILFLEGIFQEKIPGLGNKGLKNLLSLLDL